MSPLLSLVVWQIFSTWGVNVDLFFLDFSLDFFSGLEYLNGRLLCVNLPCVTARETGWLLWKRLPTICFISFVASWANNITVYRKSVKYILLSLSQRRRRADASTSSTWPRLISRWPRSPLLACWVSIRWHVVRLWAELNDLLVLKEKIKARLLTPPI